MTKGSPVWIASALVLGAGLALGGGSTSLAAVWAQTSGTSGAEVVGETTGPDSRPPIHVILAAVTAAGYSAVTKVEHEHGRYEVKAHDAEGRKVELYVRPETGKLLKHPKTGKLLKENIDE